MTATTGARRGASSAHWGSVFDTSEMLEMTAKQGSAEGPLIRPRARSSRAEVMRSTERGLRAPFSIASRSRAATAGRSPAGQPRQLLNSSGVSNGLALRPHSAPGAACLRGPPGGDGHDDGLADGRSAAWDHAYSQAASRRSSSCSPARSVGSNAVRGSLRSMTARTATGRSRLMSAILRRQFGHGRVRAIGRGSRAHGLDWSRRRAGLDDVRPCGGLIATPGLRRPRSPMRAARLVDGCSGRCRDSRWRSAR